jgi:death-on-curing protein
VKRRLRFLTVEQVLAIHDVVLERFGGAPGGGPRGEAFEGVDAAVQAVRNSYYETVEELAAAHAVYIVQGQVFLDGNKRTGAAAMLTFLEANGVTVRIAAEELARAMIDLQKRSEAGASAARLVSELAALLARRRVRKTRR